MKTIGIIGAGLSGLVTAKTLKEHGFNVVVFEQDSEVGGVWASSRRYPGIRPQNTKDTYAFSDFPMPADYPEWPSGEQIQAYLESYAKHFKVLPAIHLNTSVKHVQQHTYGWTVEAERSENGTKSTFSTTVDFLTVCNGIHNIPNLPEHAKAAEFKAAGGEIYHSSQIPEDATAFEGKKVVVVGFAKSACDIAASLSDYNAETHLIYRRTYWKVPMKFFGVLNYKYLLVNRLGESLFPYPKQFWPEKFLQGIGKPVFKTLWASLEWVFRKQCRLKQNNIVPTHPVEHLGSPRLSLTTPGFYDKLEAGKIQGHRTEIERFEQDGVWLNDGSFVQADVVIYATGWKQEIRFMDAAISEKIRDASGAFQLYRKILPIDVPNLAFVGYNSSLCCQLTSEIAAHWTAQYIKGALPLPSTEVMRVRQEVRNDWWKKRNPHITGSQVSIAPFTFHYVDELMTEMGLSFRRANAVVEWITPFNPARYKGLTEELEALQTQTKQVRHLQFAG